jgi:hypothetical protein
MPYLIDETPDASAWVQRNLDTLSAGKDLGRLTSAVIWTDSYKENGEPIGGSDPSAIVNEINELGWPLWNGHDPGRPAGRFIGARDFYESERYTVCRRNFDILRVSISVELCLTGYRSIPGPSICERSRTASTRASLEL